MSAHAGKVVISDYKTHYDRYARCITEVATREVHRVFTWLYKGGEMYVGDYLRSNFKSVYNKLGKKDKKKLEERMPTERMDISLLYSLIQHTCDLSPPDDNIWQKPLKSQTDSIEHSLYQLKEKRNELAHEDQMLKKISDDKMVSRMEEVNKLCQLILTEAGKKCSKIQDLAYAIMDMEEDFQGVMGVDAKHIAKLGRSEKQAKTQQNMEFYVSPILTYKGNHLQLSDIITVLQKDDTPRTIIFLRGDAGSGKSTLCQYLDYLWTADEKKIQNLKDYDLFLLFQNLQDYDLLLLFQCREVCTRDPIMLLQEDLLPDTMKYCDPYKIPKLLQDLKILWIIDGLEEATKEATDLIRSLLKDDNSSQTFILASRPEFIYGITRYLKEHEYNEVTVCGVNPNDLLQSMRNSQPPHIAPLDLQRFMSDFINLNKNIQYELQNPLKLGVAMKLWNKTEKKLFEDSSLSELYKILAETQIESLAEKLTGGMVTKGDAHRKVTAWFNYFCQIAYDLTITNYILIITNADLEKLKRKCDDLQVTSAICLSEFLTCNDQGNYQFLHSTQQYHLAATYAAEVFMSTTKDIEKSALKYPEHTTEKDMKYTYEILLHMVSILQDSLNEKQVRYLIKQFVCKIDTENATPRWFEVIRNADCHELFLKTIGNIIPERWFISDQNIKAATHLIKYKLPKQVIIKLDNDPMNSGIEDLLYTLAKSESRIIVELYLEYHFRVTKIKGESDGLLRIISGEPSMCSILGFSGHLSLEGCKLLNSDNITNNCSVLQLNVSTTKSLSTIYHHVRTFQKISVIQLIFTFWNYGSANIKNTTTSAFKGIIVDLHLCSLFDNQVQNGAKLIHNLGESFNCITTYKLSKSGAQNFVELLQKNKVRANALLRYIVNEEKKKSLLVNFGSLPLQYDIGHFLRIWANSEKNY